jgi:hypothetical protein
MPSINRRSKFAFRFALLALVICAVGVAPKASAGLFDKALVSGVSLWDSVVVSWNGLIEAIFAPDGARLDPWGRTTDAQAPPADVQEPTATQEGPTA